MRLGVVDFSRVHFAIGNPDSKYFLFAELKRDSHINWYQRLIMWLRFDKNEMEVKSFGNQA
ncbi:hypothetical protein D9M71_725190 [compost metagenome]